MNWKGWRRKQQLLNLRHCTSNEMPTTIISNIFSSSNLSSKNMKIKIYRNIILPDVINGHVWGRGEEYTGV